MSIAAEATRSEFQYNPLQGSRTIRLIEFLSGPTLQCRMRTCGLADAPAYVALSYTWGSPIFEKSLEVDGCTLRITKNLHEAVTQLYDYARNKALLFWADSICVNQQDLEERSEQVQMMSDIYGLAKTVLIWLGPITSSIEFAIDRMVGWDEHLEYLRQQTGKTYYEISLSFNVSDPRFLGEIGSDRDRAFEGLRELCSRKWWTRVWIVQESMANPDSTEICCGNRIIAWETLDRALSNVRFTQFHRHTGEAGRFFNGNHYILSMFRRMKMSGHMMELVDILGILQCFDCEDPRDKVYACLGLADHSVGSNIIPDYTKTCLDVYQDVVATLLSSSVHHSLDFLGYINMPSDVASITQSQAGRLPSWIPDWANPRGHCPLQKYLNIYSSKDDRVYNASGSISKQVYISKNRLHLRGSTLDTIARLTDAVTTNLELDFTVEKGWRPTSPDREYLGGGTLLEAYQHTLTADLDVQPEDEYLIHRGGFVDWSKLSFETQGLSFEESLVSIRQHTNIKGATYDRSLIETNLGYIGLGPEGSKVGDQVCVFYGGQVLYILRECGSHEFTFVGECYLHGMMDGEALEHKDFSEREFVLV